jgi:hypothetical protein
VVLDPIQLSIPEIELRQLRTACDDTRTLLILDETKTAFRVALGDVQELHGVAADVTVAGKAMANGFPLSSVLGPANIVRAPGTRIKGTFSNERVVLAAAKATLDILEHERVQPARRNRPAAHRADRRRPQRHAGRALLLGLDRRRPARFAAIWSIFLMRGKQEPPLHLPTGCERGSPVVSVWQDGVAGIGRLVIGLQRGEATMSDGSEPGEEPQLLHDHVPSADGPSDRQGRTPAWVSVVWTVVAVGLVVVGVLWLLAGDDVTKVGDEVTELKLSGPIDADIVPGHKGDPVKLEPAWDVTVTGATLTVTGSSDESDVTIWLPPEVSTISTSSDAHAYLEGLDRSRIILNIDDSQVEGGVTASNLTITADNRGWLSLSGSATHAVITAGDETCVMSSLHTSTTKVVANGTASVHIMGAPHLEVAGSDEASVSNIATTDVYAGPNPPPPSMNC